MKKKNLIEPVFVFASFLFLIFTGCKQPRSEGFTIKGSLTNMKDSVVYISHASKDIFHPVIDTLRVTNGSFQWRGKVTEPLLYYIYTASSRKANEGASFFVGDTVIHIHGNADSINQLVITGGKTQRDYNTLNQTLKAVQRKIDSLNNLWAQYMKTNDTAATNKLRSAFTPFETRQLSLQKEFVTTHPNSIVSAYLLSSYLGSRQPVFERLALFQQLDTAVQRSFYGKQISESTHWDTVGLTGHQAMAFTGTSVMDGKKISLSDYRGKYVLLDFWASWCVPCRASNPRLREIWKKYQNKNFQIIGIGDNDHSPDKLKAAIIHDKVGEWPHILRGWQTNQDLDKFYSVQEIPTKILINPEGKIIYRCEENTDTLDQKLTSIFNNSH